MAFKSWSLYKILLTGPFRNYIILHNTFFKNNKWVKIATITQNMVLVAWSKHCHGLSTPMRTGYWKVSTSDYPADTPNIFPQPVCLGNAFEVGGKLRLHRGTTDLCLLSLIEICIHILYPIYFTTAEQPNLPISNPNVINSEDYCAAGSRTTPPPWSP